MYDKYEVLIIDYNREFSDTLGKILVYEGYSVLQAFNIAEGRILFEDHTPGVIIIDYLLWIKNKNQPYFHKMQDDLNINFIVATLFDIDIINDCVSKNSHIKFLEKTFQYDNLLSTVKVDPNTIVFKKLAS